MSEDVKKQRRFAPFDPATEFATRYPDWILYEQPLPLCDHLICWKLKVVAVDPSTWGDLDWIIAVCLAHIDLGHGSSRDGHDGEPFTRSQLDNAEWLAKLWLDMDIDQVQPAAGPRAPRLRLLTHEPDEDPLTR